MSFKVSAICTIILSLFGTTANAQTILFNSTNHVVLYELEGNNVEITIEDLQDFTLDNKSNADSSLIDFAIIQVDQNQNGLLDPGTDEYYTHNILLSNKCCKGTFNSATQLGSCGTNTGGIASVELARSITSNKDHVIYKFIIPQSELMNGSNICGRISVVLHRAGDDKNTLTKIPSGSSSKYFVDPYLSIPLYLSPDLGNDIEGCKGDTVFSSNNYPTYSWNTGSDLNYAIVADSGNYILTVADNTCSLTDTIVVNARSKVYCEAKSLQFPTMITPNNDGINDNFELINNNHLSSTLDYSKAELSIYNRWGVQVGGRIGLPPFWDIYLDWGQKAPSGTYFYTYSPDGTATNVINGFFTVLYSER